METSEDVKRQEEADAKQAQAAVPDDMKAFSSSWQVLQQLQQLFDDADTGSSGVLDEEELTEVNQQLLRTVLLEMYESSLCML